jgi:hypothetical protein
LRIVCFFARAGSVIETQYEPSGHGERKDRCETPAVMSGAPPAR